MSIQRDYYLQRLIRKKHNGLVKVITGIKRCGKSYLLNELFYHHLLESGVKEDHIIRFSFDSAVDLVKIGESLLEMERQKRGADPEKFLTYINSKIVDDDKTYLLLDEIQMLDCFVPVLNGYLRNKNLDIYVTGSNAKLLSNDVVTEFAGRGDEIRLYPLSFSEIMSFTDKSPFEAFQDYMVYGGLPLIALESDPTEKGTALEKLFKEIYLKDILLRNRIENTEELEELLNVLSSSIGSLTNPQKLENTFHSKKKSKITAPTIKKYIDYFEDSFLLESASRYDIKGKAYIDTPKKYYFTDLGLRNARLSFRQVEQTHAMENVIYNELRRKGYQVDVGVIPYAMRDEQNKVVRKQLEVDFICNLGSSRFYIQSALSIPDEEKREQEVRPLRRIDDSFQKIIITKDFIRPYYDENGILTMSIYDFLLDSDRWIR